jgi:Tfp pilus assembly protein PilO
MTALRAAWATRYGRPFLAVLGLNLVVFVLFTLPQSVRERHLSVRIVGLREQIAEQRRASAEIGRQVEIINANIAQTQRFYKDMIKTREHLPQALGDLYQMATGIGLRVTQTGYQETEVKGARLMSMQITMPVSGTYEQMGQFLHGLEHASFFLIVNQVQMKGRSTDGGVDLDIRLETFFTRDKS